MKKAFSLLFALCAAAALFAFDAGGTFGNTDSFSGADFSSLSYQMSFSATAWMRQPLGNFGSLAAEGVYRFNGTAPLSSSSGAWSSTHFLDLTLLKFTANVPVPGSTLRVEAGRFGLTDLTGYVFNQNSDGLHVTYPLRGVTLSAYAGYTGLLNARAAAVSHLNSFATDTTRLYPLAPKYVVGAFRAAMPSLFGTHTVSAEVMAALNVDKNSQSNETSRFYGTVSAFGPLASGVYYSLNASGSYVTKDKDNLGILAGGSLVFYPQVLSSSVSLSATYASPNFTPFSAQAVTMSGGYRWSNVLDSQLAVTCKPVSMLLLSLSTDLFMLPDSTGALADGAVQWMFTAMSQLASDVAVSASVGQIIPLDKNGSGYFSANLSLTIAL